MTDLNDLDIERMARKRAKAKIGWMIHATVYLCVNVGLIAMWTLNDRDIRLAPALGWGLGLALHGISVWFLQPGGSFTERMVQRERERIKRGQ